MANSGNEVALAKPALIVAQRLKINTVKTMNVALFSQRQHIARQAGLLLKQVVTLAARLGYAEQVAQVNKVALRALLFVSMKRRAAGAPFGDEVLCGHGVQPGINNPAT